MKFNWGHGITIFLIIFVSTTIGVVILISTDPAYDHEVVSDFYYKEGLEYQYEIERENNLNSLDTKFSFKNTEDGIVLHFPSELPSEKLRGSVEMFRPSKKILDFKQGVKVDDNNQMLIPKDKLIRGKWRIKVLFRVEKEEYLYKSEIVL